MELEKELLSAMQKRRQQQRAVGRGWICRMARLFLKNREEQGLPPLHWRGTAFTASKQWASNFTALHGWKLRRRACKRKDKPDEAAHTLRAWHLYYRELVLRGPDLVNQPAAPTEDRVWGKYPPHTRFSCDTTGIDSFLLRDTTYASREEREEGRIALTGYKEGKRMASLHLTLCGDDAMPLMRPTVIFKGAGQVLDKEAEHYDPDVRVLFQRNAWLDTETLKAFYETEFLPYRAKTCGQQPALLLLDNLEAQRSPHLACFLLAYSELLLWPSRVDAPVAASRPGLWGPGESFGLRP